MRTTYRLLCSLIAGVCLLALAGTTASAQNAYSLTKSPLNINVEPGGFAGFHIDVHNISGGQLTVRIFRIQNVLPDDGWVTAICTGQKCFDPKVDTPDPAILAPDEKIDVQLSLSVSAIMGSKGYFTLVLDSGPGTPSDTIRMSAVVSNAGSVPFDVNDASLAAWPNPATSLLSIPVPASFRNDAAATVDLFDARGNLLPTPESLLGSDGTRSIDVSTLAPGAYFYRLNGRTKTFSGSFVVAR